MENERMYQKAQFVERYRSLVPVKQAKKIFDKAWYNGMRLGTIIKTANFMAETWMEAKAHYGKK